jgi:hypothetical protein
MVLLDRRPPMMKRDVPYEETTQGMTGLLGRAFYPDGYSGGLLGMEPWAAKATRYAEAHRGQAPSAPSADQLMSALEVMPGMDPSNLAGGMVGITKGVGRRLLYDAPYSNYKIDPDLAQSLEKGTIVKDTGKYVPEKHISPEDLARDGYLLNFVGDRTNVGQLASIGGRELSTPITLDGGRGYMRGNDTGVWASDAPVINALSRRARAADGRPVYGSYMAMSGTGSDFANMTREAVLKDFDTGQIFKKDIKEFNKRFKSAKAYDQRLLDDFPGFDSPELDAWLDKSGTRPCCLV